MAVEKKVSKDEDVTLQEKIDKAIDKAFGDKIYSPEGIGEVLTAQTEALKRIADQAVPSNTKAAIARLDAEHETPYIEATNRVGVLFVSTQDLASVDGWPGYIDQPLDGEYTKQGLRKRARIQVKVVYQPSLAGRYEFVIMDTEEFNKTHGKQMGSVPNATQVAALSLRSGDAR
jgi:hypothetical protein